MIEAIGLTKRYGRTLAVDDLSFVVEPGKVTGFLGPNGAGKSTTMRMILGLDRPSSGRALLGGRRYRDLKHPLRTVGTLLDAKWIHPHRSARSHLKWLARSNDLPMDRVGQVLDAVGLSEVASHRVGGFSLGMSQRLGIAAALLGDPELLMFDEPVNGLDPEGILWIRKFMKKLATQGRTVFVSSHMLSEMALTAENLVVIGKGRLIAQCTTSEFIRQSAHASVLVRSPQLAELHGKLEAEGYTVKSEEDSDGRSLRITTLDSAPIGELAAKSGIVLHQLTTQRASLEEAFMELTRDTVTFSGSTKGTQA
ncbi:ATP-binding cassette domain-containing protein [Pseudonocardiaceae bacterium YIM PH 21723]|nr:ATP-binding cassette domain-containing protein [Pseudonocardiaceae bacterium YIM PH 21723]